MNTNATTDKADTTAQSTGPSAAPLQPAPSAGAALPAQAPAPGGGVAPPAAPADTQARTTEPFDLGTFLKGLLLAGLVSALFAGFLGYRAPARAKSKLRSWQPASAIVTAVETRGIGRRQKAYVTLTYSVHGQSVTTENAVGRTTDAEPGDVVEVLVSPRDVHQTEALAEVKQQAAVSPSRSLLAGVVVGFIGGMLLAGILVGLWWRIKRAFSD